ncbi:MAG TPA: BBP7 family outer membrane beta-barrel protein [Lacipirellulaceae bacterium]|nr:BBP7 family outer membrane beta-barrel protein [Lacipirellulaceae bacterium]
MRIGPIARSQTTAIVALFAAAAAIAMLPTASFGQYRTAAFDASRSTDGQGAVQAIYTVPTDGMAVPARPYVDANGNPMVVPAGYCDPCGECCCSDSDGQCAPYGPCGDGTCGGSMCGGGFMGSCPMGAGGTDPPIGYDLMNDTGIQGDLVDQRGPHYWDIRAETVFMRRDKGFDKNVDFTALNVGGPVVLSSRDLNSNEDNFKQNLMQITGNNPDVSGQQSSNLDEPNWGFRIMGRYDICPFSVVEFGYTGIFDWNASASVTDAENPGNLYSLFSRPAPGSGLFGTNPNTVSGVNNPFPETEQANTQSISFQSDLQTAEISYRRYWLGYIPRVSGTLLAGFRYTRVNEDFNFTSLGSMPLPGTTNPLAGLRYAENCNNDLAGFQTGGDIWIALTQGLRIGSEGKVGIYNNHSKLTNHVFTTPPLVEPGSLFEQFTSDHPAFIGEASVDLVADLFPSLSLRAGYEVLFLNELVLAGDNFNETSPYGNQGTRVPFVDDNGDLFYYGGHVGLEYTW